MIAVTLAFQFTAASNGLLPKPISQFVERCLQFFWFAWLPAHIPQFELALHQREVAHPDPDQTNGSVLMPGFLQKRKSLLVNVDVLIRPRFQCHLSCQGGEIRPAQFEFYGTTPQSFAP